MPAKTNVTFQKPKEHHDKEEVSPQICEDDLESTPALVYTYHAAKNTAALHSLTAGILTQLCGQSVRSILMPCHNWIHVIKSRVGGQDEKGREWSSVEPLFHHRYFSDILNLLH